MLTLFVGCAICGTLKEFTQAIRGIYESLGSETISQVADIVSSEIIPDVSDTGGEAEKQGESLQQEDKTKSKLVILAGIIVLTGLLVKAVSRGGD